MTAPLVRVQSFRMNNEAQITTTKGPWVIMKPMSFLALEKFIKSSWHIIFCNFTKVWSLISHLGVMRPWTSAGLSGKQVEPRWSNTEAQKNERSFALMNLPRILPFRKSRQTPATFILAYLKSYCFGYILGSFISSFLRASRGVNPARPEILS